MRPDMYNQIMARDALRFPMRYLLSSPIDELAKDSEDIPEAE